MLSWRPVRRTLPYVVVLALLGLVLVAGPAEPGPADLDVRSQPADVEPASVREHTVPAVAPSVSTKARSTSGSGPHVVAELPRTTVDRFELLGVTWNPMPDSSDLAVEVQWRHDDAWSDWTELHLELGSTAEGGRPGTESQWVDGADGVAVRVTSTSEAKPTGLRVATIDAGTTPDIRTAAATVGQPPIIMRSQWGARPNSGCDTPHYGSSTKGAVIHHTAGSNTYSASDSAKIVKATQAYHMDSRHWCDIGYNFLVDKYGQIFEGRGGGITKPVRAAHSGNDLVNQLTMGVSMMGTFTDVEPTAATKKSVADLVAWRFAQYHLPAKGTMRIDGITLNRISGHRDVHSTECPGAMAYAWLSAGGGLRDEVEQRLENGVEPVETLPDGVSRVGGSDRYETAALISKSTHSSASTVFVATGEGFADGLSGGPAAGKRGAPLLLTRSDSLPDVTAAEITRLKPSKVYVLGGTQVVSTKVVNALAALGPDVDRISGSDRYGTAAAVAEGFWPSGVGTVYLAAGSAFPDALSGGAAAAKATSPLLLTRKTSLPKGTQDALRALHPTRVVIVGGEAVISDSLKALLIAKYKVGSVDREAGADRYQTSAAVMDLQWNAPIGTLMLASGADFPDALAGSAASRAAGAALALSRKTCVPYDVDQVLGSSTPKYVLLGGSSVLSAAVSQNVCPKPVPTKPPASGKDAISVPSSGEIKLTGHGYGHGIGMSQYGAEGGARAGKSATEILAHYYPGTKLATETGYIRVKITADTTDSVIVVGRSGLTLDIVGGPNFDLPTSVSGTKVERWRINPMSADETRSQLDYRTSSGWHRYNSLDWAGAAQFEASTLTLIMPNDDGVVYRTALRSVRDSSDATRRDTINVLSLENYTRGVVARESPASWHAAALQAQAVAARTYGAQSIHSGGYYDICDTTSCQVYGGYAAETSSTDSAVSKTSGKILTYGGEPAFTQFSSSSGGYTNQGSKPYLKPVSDPWDDWSGNPNHDWAKTVKASTIEKQYSSIGTLKSLEITKRNGHGDFGGRVESLKMTGTKGSKTISGPAARFAFGLKSDWFAF